MDIITFGSGIWDIFLEEKDGFFIKDRNESDSRKDLCFSLGSKFNIDDIYFSTGGGGINTAITFANQGFKTAFCGKIGEDLNGETILEELKKSNVQTEMTIQTEKNKTDHSVIFLVPGQDRTILTYRGASQLLTIDEINFKQIKKAKWLYLAPLSKKLTSLFFPLVNFAFENKIKIAVNPGMDQLNLPKETLRKVLKKIDILILNKEEAGVLTNTDYQNEKEILNKLDRVSPGIKIMTKGPKGLIVLHKDSIWSAKSLNEKVIERTGAGDAFGSGFVSGYIKYNGNIEKAIQLGSGNATACLKEYGAQKGLLKPGEKYRLIEVKNLKTVGF